MYNASASRLSGFDQNLFEFLAHRIAAAIVEAAKNGRPATVRLLETRVPGLMRNRSLQAFMLNPKNERNTILEENVDLPAGVAPEKYSIDAYRAVNPRLTVLKVESASGRAQTIGIAAFIAVHPTAMRNSTAVYNGDLFGVAATVVEQALHAGPHPSSSPVVAIFNGAEGDISPDWERQDRRNTVRLGQILGQCILKLSTRNEALAKCRASKVDLRVEGSIEYRFTITQLANRCFKDESGFERCTADHPLPGVAMLGGAEDGRTFLYELGWQEGVRGPRHHRNQGSKQPIAWDRSPLGLSPARSQWSWADGSPTRSKKRRSPNSLG
jgi:hypothetical protein